MAPFKSRRRRGRFLSFHYVSLFLLSCLRPNKQTVDAIKISKYEILEYLRRVSLRHIWKMQCPCRQARPSPKLAQHWPNIDCSVRPGPWGEKTPTAILLYLDSGEDKTCEFWISEWFLSPELFHIFRFYLD